MTRIALEYVGYMRERVAAVGDAVDVLDLDSTVERFDSSGPCDPIRSGGLGLCYRVLDVDIPAWLIDGLRRGQVDGRWSGEDALCRAASIVLWGSSDGWVHALRPLCSKRGKFAQGLRDFFSEHGYLTDKQAAYV